MDSWRVWDEPEEDMEQIVIRSRDGSNPETIRPGDIEPASSHSEPNHSSKPETKVYRCYFIVILQDLKSIHLNKLCNISLFLRKLRRISQIRVIEMTSRKLCIALN